MIQLELHQKCADRPRLSLVRISGQFDVTACANIQQLAAALDDEPATWVDDHLFSLRMDEVESLTLNVEGRSLELQRDEAGFALGGSKPRHIDVDIGNDVLQTLVSIRGTLTSAGVIPTITDFESQDSVQLLSALVGTSDRYEERILIGKMTPNGERWVKRLSDSAILRLDSTTASSLEIDPDLLKNRSLIDVEPGAVQSVELLAHGRTFRWSAEKASSLRPEPVTGASFDSTEIEALRSRLAKLRAKKWLIRPHDPAKLSLICQVNFAILDQDNAQRGYSLHIALGQDRKTLAWLGESNDYFEPESELEELLVPAQK